MRVVMLLSGGIDSSTLLYRFKVSGYEVHALTFLYGQKHDREVKAAKAIVEAAYDRFYTPTTWRLIDLSALKDIFLSALTSSEIKIPEVPPSVEHYETLAITLVPNRNMIFLAIATAYAKMVEANAVAYAAHYSDRGIYPDCRWEFASALEVALKLALDDRKFKLLRPFIGMTKAEIVKEGSMLDVTYALTWSCYKGGEKHCGVCSSCRERKRAFQEAEVEDPTKYEVIG